MSLHCPSDCNNPETVCLTFNSAFCICPTGDSIGCTGASDPAGLLGVWSDTATTVSTFGTGAAWSNIANAKVFNDNLYATVTIPGPFNDGGGFYCFSPTQFIQLTGLGLAVPSDGTIYGFAFGVNGHSGTGDDGGNNVLNVGLTKFGSRYYFADPNSGWCPGEIGAVAPYVDVQSNFGTAIGQCPQPTSSGCDQKLDAVTDVIAAGSTATPSWCTGQTPPAQGPSIDLGPAQKKLSTIGGTINTVSWSPADCNDSSFGMFVVFGNNNGVGAPATTLSLDYFTVAVYYTGSTTSACGGVVPPGPVTYTGRTRQTFNVFNKRSVWGGA